MVKGCPPLVSRTYRLTWEQAGALQLPRGIQDARNASPRALKCLPPACLVNPYCEPDAVGGKKADKMCVCVCEKRLRNAM